MGSASISFVPIYFFIGSPFSGTQQPAATKRLRARRTPEYVPELNKNISALNGGGAVTGIDVQEDGAYITYTLPGGADPVTKKLGSTYKVVNFNESTTYVNGSFVDLGFKPIAIYAKATGRSASFVYDETYSTTKVKENKPETSATTIGSTNCLLKSISDTGFTFNMNTSNIAYGNGNFMIFAIG